MDVENRQADVPLEFEGRYLVGNTTCTITPVRMAFELRWARGKAIALFYNGTSAEANPNLSPRIAIAAAIGSSSMMMAIPAGALFARMA